MKFYFILLLLYANISQAQEWQAELMPGVAGYNGDLTEERISLKQLRPAVSFNLKYNSGDFINVRAGLSYGRVGADDKNSKDPGLRSRNLNFKTDIIELNVIAEVNLFDPENYTAYPYAFGGIGVYHFNPFTYDNNNKKTYLRPLSTEGEGLSQFVGRKKYALTQLCIPVGFGWKFTVKEKWDISYEMGVRILFTDYLDDVSNSYVDLDVLAAVKGLKSAELSYRGAAPILYGRNIRGNPAIKDFYYFSGIKITTNLKNLFKRDR
ncbi:MAG: DUF6089 family protein [Ginsengibacter sp.]